MFQIEEKLNLKDNLIKLRDAVTKDPVISSICDQYIINLNNYPSTYLVESLLKEIGRFDFNYDVNSFINKVKSIVNENVFAYNLQNTVFGLQQTYDNRYYAEAIERLKKLGLLNESELRKELSYNFEDLKWVPGVRSLVESANSFSNKLNESEIVTINKVYSPIKTNSDNTYSIYLDRKFYKVDEKSNTLTEDDTVYSDDKFMTLANVMEMFKFKSDSAVFYRGNNKFELKEVEGKTKCYVNDKLFEGTSTDLGDHLLYSGIMQSDAHLIKPIVYLYEYFNEVVELDFIQKLDHKIHEGLSVNVIRLNENVYLNKVNHFLNLNYLELNENVNYSIEVVQDYIGYDITESVKDLVSEDRKLQLINEENISKLESRIKTLNENVKLLTNIDIKDSAEVIATKELLESEITKWVTELKTLKPGFVFEGIEDVLTLDQPSFTHFTLTANGEQIIKGFDSQVAADEWYNEQTSKNPDLKLKVVDRKEFDEYKLNPSDANHWVSKDQEN